MLDIDLYVKVENGIVVTTPNYMPRPNEVGTTMEARIASGWYPVESVKPDSMNHELELWASETFEVLEDRVVWTLTKRDKTQQELDDERARWWVGHRKERNFRLAETDWVVVKSIETDTPVPAAWLTYRQALRDLTNNPDFDGTNYPEKPTV